jgi:cobalt-zinc-cadmium efflux system membrane fusion protein
LNLNGSFFARFKLPRKLGMGNSVAVAVAVIAVLFAAVMATTLAHRADKSAEADINPPARKVGNLYYPTAKQWTSLGVAPVRQVLFRPEHLTEGKISVDEDRATLVFSPYSGRVIKLMAKPGDHVVAGQPLFVVEAPDMVQAQNDFISATATLNKARSALDLAHIVETQNKSLYDTHAGPLRDLQQAQSATRAAQNDVRAAEISVEATRNRLRILGLKDDEITKFGETGDVSPQTTIYSPISGIVIQRKVGPGQYINTSSQNPSASDPTFVIGDLSTVWLVAYVRESEARNIQVGQALRFTVLAYPNQVFTANISYVATALDPATRRLLVRATIDNAQGQFRPEMFASVTIMIGDGDLSPAVPRDAIIYDGNTARVWIVHDDQSVEQRAIKTGLSSGNDVEVIEGLSVGEKVVAKGSLFVDRAAAGT